MGLRSGLFAYYPLDVVGSQMVLDHSGFGRNLAFNDQAPFVATNGTAGAGQTMATGTNPREVYEKDGKTEFDFYGGGFSFFAVLNYSATTGGIFGTGQGSCRLLRTAGNGNLSFRVTLEGEGSETIADVPCAVGTEYFVLATFNPSAGELTLSLAPTSGGSTVETDTNFTPGSSLVLPEILGYFRLGSIYETNTPSFQGFIKDVTLWGRGLTASERAEVIAGWRPERISTGLLNVVLLAGQSNLLGRNASVENEQFNARKFDDPRTMLTGSLEYESAVAFSSPKGDRIRRDETSFGTDIPIAASLPSGWVCFTHATPSTNLHTDWAPTTGTEWNLWAAKWAAAKAELELLGFTPVVKAVVFVQGEADSSEEQSANVYESNLTNFINEVKNLYPNSAFVISRLSDVMTPAGNGHYEFGATVQAAQDKVASRLPGVGIVNTDSLTLEDGEPNHFDANSQMFLGGMIVDELMNLLVNYELSTIQAIVERIPRAAEKLEHGEPIRLTSHAGENFDLSIAKVN